MSAHNNHDYTEEVKASIRSLGADLVGVADTDPLKGLHLDPPDLLQPFIRAISIAMRLPAAVFEGIIDRPTPLYSSIYATANRILDEISFKAAGLLQADGYRSLPVPASQVLDRKNWYGAILPTALWKMAPYQWQRTSLLLVTPHYGPRIRLATVLTNAPLTADTPLANRCGACTLCVDTCPVGAIKGMSTEAHYQNREEALYFSRCVEKLVGEFSAMPLIGAAICGLCIKACPFGR